MMSGLWFRPQVWFCCVFVFLAEGRCPVVVMVVVVVVVVAVGVGVG